MTKSIVLIGFMGVGKTTAGKLAAEKLGWNFVDTDEVIEQEYKMPVTQIFEEAGEKAFREREKSLITSLAMQGNLILSLGGGAFLQKEIRKVCLQSCHVVFLDLSFENWLKRLDVIIDSRPKLQGKSVNEMRELFLNRNEIYSQHHVRIQTDGKDAETIANEIVETIDVKNTAIGEGIPKICVPLVGRTDKDLMEEAAILKALEPDLVEWRADFFEHVEDVEKVKQVLSSLRDILIGKPIIFTFRSKKEGGEKEISTAYYFELNTVIIQTGLADFIDIELFNQESEIRKLVSIAHDNDVKVIISNHDFEKTPPKEEIISRLSKAQELGADLPKIAVMPNSTRDVLTLLDAAHAFKESNAKQPIISISMGPLGVISRIAGEFFGSAVTFGSAQHGSAPGQLPVSELKHILTLISNKK